MTQYQLAQDLIDAGWLPAKDAPQGTRFRVAHIYDPTSFTEGPLCQAEGEKDETGEWSCNVGFICVDGMLRFQPTHYLPDFDTIVVNHVANAVLTKTYLVAAAFKMPTASARSILLRLERQGRVRRHPRYSSINSLTWAMPETGGAA